MPALLAELLPYGVIAMHGDGLWSCTGGTCHMASNAGSSTRTNAFKADLTAIVKGIEASTALHNIVIAH